MLPHYAGKYEPKQKNIDSESVREILMKEDYKMIMKRRFERIYNAIETMTFTKHEDISEKKEYLFMVSNALKQIKSIIIS